MFVVTLLVASALSAVFVALSLTIGYTSYSDFGEKLTPFECGFDPLSKMRSPFSARFFLLVVLFLIFDVEIALLFPVLSSLASGNSLLLLSGLATFLMILLVGMFHEWNEGALDWVSS
uniref:NADH dehydrogenase subunit 3 n=1 Tax=Dendronotus frondosus TaxID=71302 RepID=UPI002551ED9B|nr:NADH dehydrogenase subunit 3 [Dendronotus frondosus]WGC92345.1 NADH dehydrogenase subunit 3 [Dendronotus frondosus]